MSTGVAVVDVEAGAPALFVFAEVEVGSTRTRRWCLCRRRSSHPPRRSPWCPVVDVDVGWPAAVAGRAGRSPRPGTRRWCQPHRRSSLPHTGRSPGFPYAKVRAGGPPSKSFHNTTCHRGTGPASSVPLPSQSHARDWPPYRSRLRAEVFAGPVLDVAQVPGLLTADPSEHAAVVCEVEHRTTWCREQVDRPSDPAERHECRGLTRGGSNRRIHRSTSLRRSSRSRSRCRMTASSGCRTCRPRSRSRSFEWNRVRRRTTAT